MRADAVGSAFANDKDARMLSRFVFIAALAALAITWVRDPAAAQMGKPTAKQIAAIRACAGKYGEKPPQEAELRCLFRLVADPCQKTPAGRSNHGVADCLRLEQTIWDELLNENFKALRDELDDDGQKEKLRDMQRAWVAARDATCEFYSHKIQGTMAGPMTAACLARETMRRALLLDSFRGL
jgi:uncharacterized protein YecT (DUF1311 family)